MGAEISSNELHAKTLDKYRELPIASIKNILQRYKDKDCEFGLDKPALLDFMEDSISSEEADNILQSFDRGAGMINALEFLTAITLVCEGEREIKAATIFDCFDFNNKGSITYDELTILILCFLRAIGLITGMNGEADENIIEKKTASKFTAQGMVNKTDYLTYVNDLGFFNLNTMSKECLEKFDVVQPVPEEKKAEEGDTLESKEGIENATSSENTPVTKTTNEQGKTSEEPIKTSEEPTKNSEDSVSDEKAGESATGVAVVEDNNESSASLPPEQPVEEKQQNTTEDVVKESNGTKVVVEE